MKSTIYDPLQINQFESAEPGSTDPWIWHGFLARGNITLLTSRWKAGKTTLLAGLLRALAGGTFLDRACAAASAVVVSEESRSLWASRQRAIPMGPQVRLVSRPFPGRPTPEQWTRLIDEASARRGEIPFDAFVVDPLATFLPGRSENNPGTFLDMLHPLRQLADTGVAILILHHPRKERAEEGSTARGSGALLGFVDIILELSRYGSLAADVRKRKLIGLSRHPETPRSLIYEWTPGTPEFRSVPDVVTARFRENWETVRAMLSGRTVAATHRELLMDWPPERPAPSTGQLYEWLTRAVRDGLVARFGAGTKSDPYRFLLPVGRRDDAPGAQLNDPVPG